MIRVATPHEPTRPTVPFAGSRMGLGLMGLVLVLGFLAAFSVPAHAQSSKRTKGEKRRAMTENDIKAGYLIVIPEHIRWPSTIPDDKSEPLVVAVIDDPNIADAVEQRIATRRALAQRKPSAKSKQPIIVRSFDCDTLADDPSLLDGCRVVYLSSRVPEKSAVKVLRLLAGAPVLTIEDSGRKGGPKADIELFKSGKSIKFGIRITALRVRGLEARAQLVRLGKTLPSTDSEAERGGEAGSPTKEPPAENPEKEGRR